MREQREILERHADIAMFRRHVGHVIAVDLDDARVGSSTPAMRRSSTVLPVPEPPKITTISPASRREIQTVEDLVGTEASWRGT